MTGASGGTGSSGRRVRALGALVLVVAVGVALLAGGVAGQSATDAVGPDCGATNETDGAVFVADSGLAVAHEGRTLADSPFANATTLSFANVTVRSETNASLTVAAATERRLCVVDVDPAGGRVTLSPVAGPTVVLSDPVAALSYGSTSYEPSADGADLAYRSGGPVRIALRDGRLSGDAPVRAVDAADGTRLDEARVGASGRVAVRLPAGDRSVDVRFAPAGTATPTVTSVADGTEGGDGSGGTAADRDTQNASERFGSGLPSDWRGEVVDYRPTPETQHVGGFLPLALLLATLATWLAAVRRDATSRWLAAVLGVATVRAASDVAQVVLDGLVGASASIAALNLVLELTTALLFCQFAATYARIDSLRTRAARSAFAVAGVLGAAVAFTNPLHGLVFAEAGVGYGPFTYVSTTLGPLGWALYGVTMAAVVAGGGLVLRALVGPSLRAVWRPVAVVGSGLALAVVVGAVSLLGRGPVPDYDYTASGINYFLLVTAVTLLTYGLQRIEATGQRSLVENLEYPVVVLDDAWSVVQWNDAAAALLPALSVGRSFDAVLPEPVERPAVGERTRTELSLPATDVALDDPVDVGGSPASTDGGTDVRAGADAGDGTDRLASPSEPAPAVGGTVPGDGPGTGGDRRRHYVVTATPVTIESDLLVGYAVQFADVTDLQRRTELLEAKNDRLDQFANAISRDLRAPLSTADRTTERAVAALESAADPIEVDVGRLATYFDRIDAALVRMQDLVEDVLGLARESSREADPERLRFGSVAEAAWTRVDHPAGRLLLGTDGTIRADEGHLRRILEHLFRNSAEHGQPDSGTDPDGVTIRVELTPDGFYVADDGPGVPEDLRSRCFEPGVTSKSDGSGIGLAAVAQRARAHGWNVALDEDAEGARFVVTGAETDCDDGLGGAA